MAEPFLGEIKLWAIGYAPVGWANCDGQVMDVSQNGALASLLGFHFGGNGTTTFALPDMRGRTPLNYPNTSGISLGTKGGIDAVLLDNSEMPRHTHLLQGNNSQGVNFTPVRPGTVKIDPQMFALVGNSVPYYTQDLNSVTSLSPATVGLAGQNIAHDNNQPSVVLRFTIALTGYYPSRN
ncbi:phage tail protein [Gynuella sunshinyii]|uniref:Microcystin-dependent protein n=1 Tax=Gynuella sunshinyii YC6258 TaxID=1445510 RepID=A0A0C5VFK6_9GAMM|nr:tail fiber protein [Gynuella sunshinyii]AJQ93337.1 microcystin-dependent protein [Gynuella sunshinyii YC6258]